MKLFEKVIRRNWNGIIGQDHSGHTHEHGSNFVNTIETETVVCIFVKLGRYFNNCERMNAIDYEVRGQCHYGHITWKITL